jgi:hypothetical protein
MSKRQSHHRPVPLWQIAPFLLVPPALVAAISLQWDLALTPFVTTLALSGLPRVLRLVRRSDRQLAPRRAPLPPSAQQRRAD